MKYPFLRLLTLSSALLIAGCGDEKKDKKKDKDDDEDKSSKDEKSEPEKLDEESLAELMTLEIPGFEAMDPMGNIYTRIQLKSTTDPAIKLTVQAQVCELKLLCPELTQAGFEARSDELVHEFSQALQESPDFVFEFSEQELAGASTVGTHGMSFMKKGGTSTYMHFHRLFSHDETNLLMVEASPTGSFPRSAEDLDNMVSHEDLQAAAEAAFAIYATELFESE
jgi:hypothetical protein